MKVRSIFLFFVLMYISVDARVLVPYPHLREEVRLEFQENIIDEIAIAEKKLQEVKEKFSKTAYFSLSYPLKIQTLSGSLEVKKILGEKFYNSPLIRSPVFREKFIELFEKEAINENDLINLQNMINFEKKYMEVNS